MIQIIDRIEKLTAADLEHKTDIQLYASMIEETGELAREIKIEEKVYGNTYKKLDEGVLGETVDVYICGIAMLFLLRKRYLIGLCRDILNFHTQHNIHDGIWTIFLRIAKSAGRTLESADDAIIVCANCLQLFILRGGTEEQFIKMANLKLDKWENTK